MLALTEHPGNRALPIPVILVVLMAVIILLNIRLVWWKWSGASAGLRLWADSKCYRLLEQEREWFVLKGPFAWSIVSKTEVIFRIKLLDSQKEIRTGRAKVNMRWFGFAKARIVLRWDSDPSHDAPESDRSAWDVASPDPALEQTYQGPRCVSCRHPIEAGTKICPKCDWTQPA